MFKWLKKIMISIINAVKSIFVGDREVQSVSLGDTEVYSLGEDLWPTVPSNELWRIGILNVHYSSGSKLDAAGSNYVEILATVYKYLSGSSSPYETVTMPCPLETDTSWLDLRNSNRAYGENRGTQNPSTSEGAERTGTIRAIRPVSSRYQVTGQASDSQFGQNYSVTQAANSLLTTGYEINRVIFYVPTSGFSKTFEPDDSDLTFELTDAAYSNISYSVDGYKTQVYASGSPYGNTSSGIEWTVDAVNEGTSTSCSWITVTSSSDNTGTIDVSDFSGSAGDTRQASLRIYYYSPTNSASMTVTVKQTVSAYVFTGPSTSNITNYTETFTISYTATNNGQPLTTQELNSISYTFPSNGIGCNYVSRRVYNNSAILTFSCHQNFSESTKTTRIVATFAGKSVTTTVTQAAGYSVYLVNGVSLNKGNQARKVVLGTAYMSSGQSLGIILASPDPIDVNMTAQVQVDWSYSGGGPYEGCSEAPTTITIPQGSYVNVGTSTVYGVWFKEPELNNAEINTSYTNVEIDQVGTFVVY